MGARKLTAAVREDYKKQGPVSNILANTIASLSDYFSTLDSFLTVNDDTPAFWYRGHADFEWGLAPTALRPQDVELRKRALALVHEFKRVAGLRLSREERPPSDKQLEWLGLAQHYGLPTRLLDWSENPAVALYFACLRPERDGAVFLLNPVDLNFQAIGKSMILRAEEEVDRLGDYIGLLPTSRKKRPTLAIHPIYNTQRILVQKGAFTIHGNRFDALDKKQAPSLVCLPILSAYKKRLSSELDRIGVNEMSLFPDAEHVCAHLRRQIGL